VILLRAPTTAARPVRGFEQPSFEVQVSWQLTASYREWTGRSEGVQRPAYGSVPSLAVLL